MLIGKFRDVLEAEFAARRARNARYSLRAFARALGVDHSTLSQILRAARPAPARQIRAWAARLGYSKEEAAAYVVAEQALDMTSARRQRQIDNWTAEALSVTTEPAHWAILRLCRQPGFKTDSRWIAAKVGVSVDAVNLALSRLFRLGLLGAAEPGKWKDLSGLKRLTEREFRKLALARVRERAAS